MCYLLAIRTSYDILPPMYMHVFAVLMKFIVNIKLIHDLHRNLRTRLDWVFRQRVHYRIKRFIIVITYAISFFHVAQSRHDRRSSRKRSIHRVSTYHTSRSVREEKRSETGLNLNTLYYVLDTFSYQYPMWRGCLGDSTSCSVTYTSSLRSQVLMSATLQTEVLESYFRMSGRVVPHIHMGGSVYPVQVTGEW